VKKRLYAAAEIGAARAVLSAIGIGIPGWCEHVMCSDVVNQYSFRGESVARDSAYVDSPAHQSGLLLIVFESVGNRSDST
jgi:hypothetical protein